MTALDNLEDKIVGFEAGAVDYITKPFQQPEVLARVNIHVTLRRQQQALKETQEILLMQKALLEQMTITDDLTGLHNRRNLNTILKREFHRSLRHDTELSGLMVDLDHFKKVNDVHGHDFGDLVLRDFAEILRSSVRDTDFIFRFGGEEFLLLLPQTDTAGASQTAEKIRQKTATNIFKTKRVSTSITVSIGVASVLEHHPPRSHTLISYADQALYEAKGRGRNQVVVYDPSFVDSD
jgi:diguanylate cyclase (GGDEF)-like protein